MEQLLDTLIKTYQYDLQVMSEPWMYYPLMIPILFYVAFFCIKWTVITFPIWFPVWWITVTYANIVKSLGSIK